MADCSRILANYYLQRYDSFAEHLCAERGALYFRYADDQMILLNDPRITDELLLLLTRNLDRYGLRVNQKKVDLWTAESLQQHRCRSIQSIFAGKGDNQKPALIKKFVKAYLAIPKQDLQESWNRGIPLLNRLLWSNVESLPAPYFEKIMTRFLSTEYLILADHKRLGRVAQLNKKREKPDDLSQILQEIGISTVHTSFHHETRAFALRYKDSRLETLCRKRLRSITKLMEQARTYAAV